MDNETIGALKKYWPWALGIVGLVFLYSRMGGGQTSAATVVNTAPTDAQLSANVAIAQAAYQADTAQTQAEFAATAALSQNLTDMTAGYYGYLASQAGADSATVQQAVTQAVNMGATGIAGAAQATNAYAGAVATSISSATALAGSVAQANANGPANFLGSLGGIIGAMNPINLSGKSIFTTGGILKV